MHSQLVEWTREDGLPFDPWIRVHARPGGIISKPMAKSMLIDGTIAEWEQWTGMRFPGDGSCTARVRPGPTARRSPPRPRLLLGTRGLACAHAQDLTRHSPAIKSGHRSIFLPRVDLQPPSGAIS
jgi:hypothetical protein